MMLSLKSVHTLIISLFVTGTFLYGQNKILFIDRIDTTNTKVHRAGDPDTYFVKRLDYSVSAEPVELKKEIPLNIDYKKGLNLLLNSFQYEHLNYNQILPGYSFFGLGNYYVLGVVPHEENSAVNEDSLAITTIRNVVFKKKELLEVIYKWAMPFYKIAFSMMSTSEQNDYFKELNNSLQYAMGFNIDAESSDARNMENFASSKGKLNAFIYRRIANKELSKTECLDWLKRIMTDLLEVRRSGNNEAEDLVIYEQLDADYFLGAPYTSVLRFKKKTRLLKRTGNKYEIVNDICFSEMSYVSPNLIAGIEDLPNDKKYAMVYLDSAARKIIPRTDNTPIQGYYELGEKENRRILLLNGINQEQTQALCTLFDYDSAGQVGKAFLINVMSAMDPNTFQTIYMIIPSGNYFIIQDPETKLFGLMSRNGTFVLTPTNKSIVAGKHTNEFLVNKKPVKFRD